MLVTTTTASIIKLPLSAINDSDTTQIRVKLNQGTIHEYADLYREGVPLPPLKVIREGAIYWLWDGFHRMAAAAIVFGWEFEAEAEVEEGTQRQAIERALSANCLHGLRRTNEDKRRAVEIALSDGEWQQWSDYRVAALCGVGETLVSTMRKEMLPLTGSDGPVVRKFIDRHGNEATMVVSNIGKSNSKSTPPPPIHAEPEQLDIELEVDEGVRWDFCDKPAPCLIIRDAFDSIMVPRDDLPRLAAFLNEWLSNPN